MRLLIVELKPDAPADTLADLPRPPLDKVLAWPGKIDGRYEVILGGLSTEQLPILNGSP